MFSRMFFRFALLLPALALLTACAGGAQPSKTLSPDTGKVQVVTSFYPLYEFARQVTGTDAAVTNLIPAGTEPHDWEPTPKDLAALQKAQLFVYIGAGFEGWAGQVLGSLSRPGPTALPVTEGMALRDGDPHAWLDPVLAQEMVGRIRDALIQVDPAHKDGYAARAKAYIDALAALDSRYRQSLAGCGRKEFVTSHAAFRYLAERYGLAMHSISGLSPEVEPTPQQMAETLKFAKEHQVKYIFFETLADPKVSQAIARELGARTLVLNPVEGLTAEEQAQGKNYISVMDENLANLRTALECR